MNERRITLAEWPTVEQPVPDEHNPRRAFETRVVTVQVSYDDGSWGGFSGQRPKRGYYLHVSVETIVREPGRMEMRSFEIFAGGLKAFIAEANRFSAKALQVHADAALDSDLCARVLSKVLTRKSLHVTDPTALSLLTRHFVEDEA